MKTENEIRINEALNTIANSKLSEKRFDYDMENLSITIEQLVNNILQELEESETIDIKVERSIMDKCFYIKTICGAISDKVELYAKGFDDLSNLFDIIGEQKRLTSQIAELSQEAKRQTIDN